MKLYLFQEITEQVAAIPKEEEEIQITEACDLVNKISACNVLLRRESAFGLREGEGKFAEEFEKPLPQPLHLAWRFS